MSVIVTTNRDAETGEETMFVRVVMRTPTSEDRLRVSRLNRPFHGRLVFGVQTAEERDTEENK